MEKIEEQLNKLSSAEMVEIPVGVHEKIMRRISYLKQIKPVLLVAVCLFFLNFLIILWRINIKLIDAEFTDMMQDLIYGLDLNISTIGTVLSSFFEVISPALVFSAILSLIGTIYLVNKIRIIEFIKV